LRGCVLLDQGAVGTVSGQPPRSMNDRQRAVGVFVHLNGHLDDMPAMARLGDLQHPRRVAHGVIIADDALMADAQDVAQDAEERREGVALFGRGDRKAAVVLGDTDLR